MKNKQIKKIIDKAKKDKRVIAVALFGSSLKIEGRDIDICVFLDKRYSNLEMSKKRLQFLRGLDDDFDIQIFQQLPIYIRSKILREGKILFCKNLKLLYDLAFLTIKEFDDFKDIYKSYIENALK